MGRNAGKWALAGAVLALIPLAALGGAGSGQTMQEQVAALTEANRQRAISLRRADQFEAASRRSSNAADKLRADEAALAARIQASEADITAAHARIALIEQLRAEQRARMAAKQAPVARLIAALQTMARRPPVLALVQPGSIDDIVHVRAALTTVLPAIREKTAGLRAEMAEGDRLHDRARQAATILERNQKTLADQRLALARLEATERVRSARLADSAMYEQDRAMALAAKAQDITDLMKELGDQATVQDRLMTLEGPVLRPAFPGQAGAPPPQAVDPVMRSTRYRLPVIGRVVAGMGEVSKAGVRSRGLTFATAPGAQVVAPTAGRIAYAGSFRGYGRIVIIDHGQGWTTLITGLGGLAVRIGDTVDPGSPVGRALNNDPRVTVELRRGDRAIDITPLLAVS